VHDGETTTNSNIKKESTIITEQFIKNYNLNQFGFEKTDMIAGSDFVPFVNVNIPSGNILFQLRRTVDWSNRNEINGTKNYFWRVFKNSIRSLLS
jgi:hypothetical protein